MPWQELSSMESRLEFVRLVEAGDVNVAALCRRFGISRKTAYKWLTRHRDGCDLAERSRRPLHSPGQTAAEVQAAVLALRAEQPSWGGRKLRRR